MSGETAAVKIMEAVVDKEEDIKSELNVFTNHSHHSNIVKFIGAFLKKDPTSDDQLWIVMQVKLGNIIIVLSVNERNCATTHAVLRRWLRN